MVSVMPPSCGGFGAVPPVVPGYMMEPPVPPHFQGYGYNGYSSGYSNFSLQANTNFAGSSLPPPGLHPANLRCDEESF